MGCWTLTLKEDLDNFLLNFHSVFQSGNFLNVQTFNYLNPQFDEKIKLKYKFSFFESTKEVLEDIKYIMNELSKSANKLSKYSEEDLNRYATDEILDAVSQIQFYN